MKIDDVIDEWEKDAAINKLELGDVSLNTAKLYAKYLRHLNTFYKAQREIDKRRKAIKSTKFDFYAGRALPDAYKNNPFGDKLSKGEIQSKVDADDEISNLDSKYQATVHAIDICKYILQALKDRTYSIKNGVEFMKMQAGL